MEIDQIRYFSVVAKTGSLRKAAELLHITPAALSKSISVLEKELGEKLILPAGRGIVVSDIGLRFAAKAESLLAEFGKLKEDVLSHNTEHALVLRIASFEVFTTWMLGALVEKFPDTQLLVHEMLPGHMETAVADGVADIGITYLPVPSAKVEHLKVGVLEMGVYGLKDKFSKKAIEDLPFVIPIAPVSGSPNKVRGLDGWPDNQIERNVSYRVTLMESALELCRRGLAVAYLPAPVVVQHNASVRDRFALTSVPTPRLPASSTKQDVYLIKRKSELESPAFKRLSAAIRTTCKYS